MPYTALKGVIRPRRSKALEGVIRHLRASEALKDLLRPLRALYTSVIRPLRALYKVLKI